MRPTHILFLVLGIGVGLAIGLTAASDRSRATREVRETAPIEPEREPLPPVAGTERPEPRPAPSVRVRRAETRAESTAIPEEMGVLELLWAGAPEETQAWLFGTEMLGGRVSLDLDREDKSATITQKTLLAGDYEVYLEVDEELSPRLWKVTIRPGSITSVDFSAPPSPELYPIPHGLARLDFTVYGLDGAPFPLATVRVYGKGLQGKVIEDFQHANSSGRGRFHLKPGAYEVRLGPQERRVALREGETVEEIFRYQDEGEVRFDADWVGGKLSLAPDGNEVWEGLPYEWMGMKGRFYYVRPGTYRLLLQTRHRMKPLPLGRIEVRRGRVEKVSYRQPTGDISVGIRCPVGRMWGDKYPIVVEPVPADPDRPPERFGYFTTHVTARNAAWVQPAWTVATHLTPGRYRVTFEAGGWETAQTEVEVGDKTVKVVLETKPLPK